MLKFSLWSCLISGAENVDNFFLKMPANINIRAEESCYACEKYNCVLPAWNMCPTKSLCEKATASLGCSADKYIVTYKVSTTWLATVFNERNFCKKKLQSHLVVWSQRTHRNKHTERIAFQCQLRSKTCWLAEFCNSQWISLFAAFFIDMGT